MRSPGNEAPRRGAATFSVVVLALCFSQMALAGEKPPISPATSEQSQRTVERAIRYLQTECTAWLNGRKCAACHHVPLVLWSIAEAGRQGYGIDRKFVGDTAESLLGSREKLLASKIFPDTAVPPDPRPQGRGLNMGLPFLSVAAHSLPSLEEGQKQSLKLIAEEIVKKQQPDGSWEFFATLRRPPINESQTTDAVWIIMALQGETTEADSASEQREALAKATAWLNSAKEPGSIQEKALKLLLGIRSGKARAEMQATIDGLYALQRTDGGWSQTAEMPSDAYATGQTLYVLSLAGGTAARPEIKRSIDFLVATQKPDGSWPMTSRSTPDGSPGGAKLLTPITCAAASWATLALARLAPKRLRF